MKVALVNPPINLHDSNNLAPPLGLLHLARAGVCSGFEVEIVDLNLILYEQNLDEDSFHTVVIESLLQGCFDVFAITSMGINAHISLDIAQKIKNIQKNAVIILGGVYFSSIQEQVKKFYPFIDYVISGQGESKFFELLSRVSSKISNRKFNCYTKKEIDHPFEEYSLLDLEEYFSINEKRVLNYQSGYGCIYKCNFCYSPHFYSDSGLTSVEKSVEDFSKLSDLGAEHVFLVQDNFINNLVWAEQFLKKLIDSSDRITWNCYATLPILKDGTIALMGESSCTSVYLGIDAVNKSLKKDYGKYFYREKDLIRKVSLLVSNSVEPVCAFIVNLYKPDIDSIEETLRAALDVSLLGASIRINTFTRYPNTKMGDIQNQVAYNVDKIELMFDCHDMIRVNKFARLHPEIFAFHAAEIDEKQYREGLVLIFIANIVIPNFKHQIQYRVQKKNIRMIDFISDLMSKISDPFKIEKTYRKKYISHECEKYLTRL